MRTFLKIIVSVIGVAALVFGIIFIFQSGPAKDDVADGIAPVTLDKLDATYDSVAGKLTSYVSANPAVQVANPPDVTYVALTGQKTGLGLARTNVGLATLIMNMGIIDVVLGLGLILAGILIPGKEKAEKAKQA